MPLVQHSGYTIVRTALVLIANINASDCAVDVVKASPFLTAFATPARHLFVEDHHQLTT
jgi:hypothetical protein